MQTDFGTLTRVEMRSVWPKEAADFTPWLAENIGKLGEALGLDPEVIDTEAEVGDFSADIVAKDLGSDRVVVIENQFGDTDHDHLGKLMTYAAGQDAGVVVWIAEEFREEHRLAIDWLNRRSDVEAGSRIDFFGVAAEVFRIDDSRPTVEFRLVAFPNEWQRNARRGTERDVSPRGEAYRRYFQPLIDELRERHRFTGARAALPQNWYTFSSKTAGVAYGTSFALGSRVRAEVYIDLRDAARNKALFDRLHRERQGIEKEFGDNLEWERLDDRRACRVAIYRQGSIDDDESTLVEIRRWVTDRLLRLREVFGPRVVRYVAEGDGRTE